MGIKIYKSEITSSLPLPYIDEGICAGFPSPAQGFVGESIDLNEALIEHPVATFYGRVVGDSMIEEGIESGDILVIDRALMPQNWDLAVCCLEGEFTLKRIKIETDKVWLMPSNRNYEPILVTEDDKFTIWGIVTYVIKHYRRPRN